MCDVLTTLEYPARPAGPATIAVPGYEPRPAHLQPSLAHFSLAHIKDFGRNRPWSQMIQGLALWTLLAAGCSTVEWFWDRTSAVCKLSMLYNRTTVSCQQSNDVHMPSANLETH